MPETIQEFELLQWVFGRMHKECLRQTFEREGVAELSNPQALFILREKNREMSQKEIADAIGVAPPTIAVSLKRMERAGLVQRVTDEADQRRNRISLTKKGKDLTSRCRQAGVALFGKIVEGISDEEMLCMCKCYTHMIKNMEHMGARVPAKCPFVR